MSATEPTPRGPRLACVVLAHADPQHLHRLVRALDPFPVFLHCDAATPPEVFEAMTTGLPEHCRVLPRMATGWAKWENVAAEVEGYRAALAQTDASHVAVLTGTDYPIASSAAIEHLLAEHEGDTFAWYHLLPYDQWGRSGGLSRLRYRHWAWRKRMLRLPLPRRLPTDLVLAGGSQLKVLAREHAATVVRAVDERPDLVRFFRRSWVADETWVASVLSTPALQPGFAEHNQVWPLWHIGWDGTRRKSPPWLGLGDLADLEAAAQGADGRPRRVFARKFASGYDTEVLDAIDRRLRQTEPVHDHL